MLCNRNQNNLRDGKNPNGNVWREKAISFACRPVFRITGRVATATWCPRGLSPREKPARKNFGAADCSGTTQWLRTLVT